MEFKGGRHFGLIGTAVSSGLFLIFFLVRRRRHQRFQSIYWNSFGDKVVVLHQLPPGVSIPNISPFPLKLELFLLSNNISYVIDTKKPFGPKGKTPWITFRGQEIGDSTLIIQHLRHALQLSQSELSEKQISVSNALRCLIEEHFYWTLALERWVYEEAINVPHLFPKSKYSFVQTLSTWPLLFFGKRKIKEQAKGHGMGRHSRDEVQTLGLEDLNSLSLLLGDKEYFHGGKTPSEIDCSIFGMMAVLLYSFPENCVYRRALVEKWSNLVTYTENIKDKYFPNWPNSGKII